MIYEELYNLIKDRLKIRLVDVSEPSSCGGEMPGTVAVRVQVVLVNPWTGEDVVISEAEVNLG